MIRNKFYYKVKTLIPNITELPINGLICGLINELMNSSNYLEEKKEPFASKNATRVDGALGAAHAYRVIFENGEPARNGVFGRQNCTF